MILPQDRAWDSETSGQRPGGLPGKAARLGDLEWGVHLIPSVPESPRHLQRPWGAEAAAPRCSARSVSTHGGTLDSRLPAEAPGCWFLQALETFAPQPASSSPQELSSRYGNYRFLEPSVGAWGPASLWNT